VCGRSPSGWPDRGRARVCWTARRARTASGDRTQRARGIGYEYAHVAIDDPTRVAYVEIRRSQRQRACAAFLTNALRWFRRRGITVRRLLTDNGDGYRARRFAGVCRT
jgi:hypothetical protein